ncbi:Uma2 family endonuclease [Stratiformator vulcanicus]|uniref:Uma2 family endonuclease n=1 Tax=Stratiformator vulcanicus TaxID=2527980 RepID=UPI002877851B|nr:Uma2 family endonuclease [Stratiformator vulcanicus]
MSSVEAGTHLITMAEFERMPFERRAELIRGEIVECDVPGTIHGIVCVNIAFLLKSWTQRSGQPYVIGSNDSYILISRDPDTVRGPDLFVIEKSKLGKSGPTSGTLTATPDLVVEVVSPSNSWKQIETKVDEYLCIGVKAVWVIVPNKRCVHVFRPDVSAAIVSESEMLDGQDVLPEFRCSVEDLFDNTTF